MKTSGLSKIVAGRFCSGFRWDAGWAFVVLAVVEMVWTLATLYGEFGCHFYNYLMDSPSYEMAWVYDYSRGYVSIERPPLLPLLIGAGEWLTGTFTGAYTLIAVVQWLIFLCSVRYMWKTVRMVVPGRKSRLAVMALYVFYPTMAVFNFTIMSESLSVSGSVFFIYSLLCAFRRQSGRYAAAAGLWVLLMVMLRPAGLYLVVAMGLFWSIVWLRWRRASVAVVVGLASTAVCCGAVWCYNSVVTRTYGLRAMTDVSNGNTWYDYRAYGWITPETFDDQRIAPFVGDTLRWSYEIGNILPVWEYVGRPADGRISNAEFEAKLDSIRSLHIRELPVRTAGKFVTAANHRLFFLWNITPRYNLLVNALQLKISHLYIFLLIYGGFWLYSWQKNRRFPMTGFLLGMLVCGAVAVMVIGAMNQYGRLVMSAVPFMLLMVGQLTSLFNISSTLECAGLPTISEKRKK